MKWLLAVAILGLAAPALAHVGSPDIFYEADAGAYHVLVSIVPPDVIPGLAALNVRVTNASVSELHVLSLPLTADNSAFPPTPDLAERSLQDEHAFSGHLWLMSTGSWQVKLLISGEAGEATLAVPVAALPTRVAPMGTALTVTLFGLLWLLVHGLVAIVAAAVREGALEPGSSAAPADKSSARRSALVTSLVLALVVFGGARWWSASAQVYAQSVYKPLALAARVEAGRLQLSLAEPGWLPFRKLDDFVPDHGHLMHLFIVKVPALDRLWHLHPDETAPAHFEHNLPSMSAGTYALYADVVHEDGLAETLTSTLTLDAVDGAALAGDDASGEAPPVPLATSQTVTLPDGATLTWQKPNAALRAGETIDFRFTVSKNGAPSADLQPYMGMLAHAAILAADGSVFVHLHPSGSVPMAALAVAQGSATTGVHTGHHMSESGASQIAFPYGFPHAGTYRIFVQLRRGGQVQTAAFDTRVD